MSDCFGVTDNRGRAFIAILAATQVWLPGRAGKGYEIDLQ